MKEFLQKASIKLARIFSFLHKPSYKYLGQHSVVYKPFMIRGRKYVSIGDECFIRNGARIEVIEHYGKSRFSPELTIGNNTTFEQNLHLTCAKKITIGHACVFSANIFITDIDHTFVNNERLIENELHTSEVVIGNGCFVGMGSFIFAGTELGNNVVVGANSVVKGKYPDNVMIVGSPAKVIKKYDEGSQQWIKV